jgi:hypothetical protein
MEKKKKKSINNIKWSFNDLKKFLVKYSIRKKKL